MWVGLAVMLILIGAGVFVSSVLGPPATYGAPYMMQFPGGLGWVPGALGIVFLVWLFGVIFGGWGRSRRYYRRRYWYGDAHEILRQRYARGEITREQFDQMTRDLDQHP